MTLILELMPEVGQRLNVEAARRGKQTSEFVTHLLEHELKPKEFDLEALLALPHEDQERIMQKAFDAAASDYNADLALPIAEREITDFTVLDGDEIADSR